MIAAVFFLQMSGVTYKSYNTSVATINKSTGLINAKKTGTARIIIKYKSYVLKCDIKVVSGLSRLYKELRTEAKSLAKAYGKGVTSSNRYSLVNKSAYYYDMQDELRKARNYDYSDFYKIIWGTQVNDKFDESTYTYVRTVYVREPVLAHAHAIMQAIDYYAYTKNPIATKCSKTFKISSVAGKGDTVIVKLKSNVSSDQIFGIKAATVNVWDNYITSSKKASFPIYIRDNAKRQRYYGIATVTKGSKTMTIKLKDSKLTKNRKYKLVACEQGAIRSDWIQYNKNKITFKAK